MSSKPSAEAERLDLVSASWIRTLRSRGLKSRRPWTNLGERAPQWRSLPESNGRPSRVNGQLSWAARRRVLATVIKKAKKAKGVDREKVEAEIGNEAAADATGNCRSPLGLTSLVSPREAAAQMLRDNLGDRPAIWGRTQAATGPKAHRSANRIRRWDPQLEWYQGQRRGSQEGWLACDRRGLPDLNRLCPGWKPGIPCFQGR